MKKIITIILLIAVSLPRLNVNAQVQLPLTAASVVLMEQSTGRILYSNNANERRYPASTTKMLTALVVYQHLSLDTVVVVGQEIRNVPSGFTRAGHFEGETITVEMLLNGLLIPSGNDSGVILAMEVAREIEGRRNISYNEAQQVFARAMNVYAASLGVANSNFNNSYGRHSDSHFTTAYDIALIGRAFMQNEVLAQISATRVFSNDSLGGANYPQAQTRTFTWTNTNLMLPGAMHAHPYITGGRTGFTSAAGHSLVAGASHNGLDFIAVVLFSSDPERWQDTRVLIDYGIFNFSFREIAIAGQLSYTATIENPRLGDSDSISILFQQDRKALLSHLEYAELQQVFTFDPLLLVEHDKEHTMLRAPLEEGEIVGTVLFQLPSTGEVVFTTGLVAGRDVYARTFDSDMDYYIAMILNGIFTRRALPYWIAFFGVLFGVSGFVAAIMANRRVRNFMRRR